MDNSFKSIFLKVFAVATIVLIALIFIYLNNVQKSTGVTESGDEVVYLWKAESDSETGLNLFSETSGLEDPRTGCQVFAQKYKVDCSNIIYWRDLLKVKAYKQKLPAKIFKETNDKEVESLNLYSQPFAIEFYGSLELKDKPVTHYYGSEDHIVVFIYQGVTDRVALIYSTQYPPTLIEL